MACYVIPKGRSLLAIVSGHFYCLAFYYATEFGRRGLLSVSGVWIYFFSPKSRLARNHGIEFQEFRIIAKRQASAHDFSHSRAELSRYFRGTLAVLSKPTAQNVQPACRISQYIRAKDEVQPL